VGKAKNLKKRMASYFNKTLDSQKTIELVKRIDRFEYTIVHTEQDAFLLENALIKQYMPRFNILMKDDKSYPYIVIKNEPFPRVFLTRRKLHDKAEYIGPFTSINTIRDVMLFMKPFIPLRSCNYNLSELNIQKNKFKVCLEYHLGNCHGPCEGKQTAENYTEYVQQLKNVVKGNVSSIIKHYQQQMLKHAANMQFELAEQHRKKIEQLQQYQSKSVIISNVKNDIDVFAIKTESDIAFVHFMQVVEGSIIQTHTLQFQHFLDETIEDIFCFAIAQIRKRFNSQSSEIVVPIALQYADATIKITTPKAGDKYQLILLAQKNVQHFAHNYYQKKILHLDNDNAQLNTALQQLQQQLQLLQLPLHIECFDNSNFQGSFPVSAMVCFKNGLPSKNEYRKFDVKTVDGINDFATMKEVVYRRYSRLVHEAKPLPQLVIIDGGKGQLSSAMESITALNLQHKMVVVGLAKNEEELFFPTDTQSIKLIWNSPALLLVRRIRDEVHRFVIGFHRQKRSTGTFKNELENIDGIGDATAKLLLQHFKSVKKVKAATPQQLESLVGKHKTSLILAYFNTEQLQ
jgi:excinuclease ABC subunit C